MPKARKDTLTQEQIRALLNYDTETGIFTWKARGRPDWDGRNAGTKCGTMRPNGYLIIAIYEIKFLAHRVAWMWVHGHWPPEQIDHINGDRSDNRIANIRLANNSENNRNRGIQKNTSSGFRGVSWHKLNRMWRTRIRANGREHLVGYFHSLEEAGQAYVDAAKKFHGEFAPNSLLNHTKSR